MFWSPQNSSDVVERNVAINNTILESINKLHKGGVPGLFEKIPQIKLVLENGIVKSQLIQVVTVYCRAEDASLQGEFVFKIDWDRNSLHIKNGDRFIEVKSTKDISEALDVVIDIFVQANKILDWKSSEITYETRPNCPEKDRKKFYKAASLAKISESKSQDIANFDREAAVCPELIDELEVSIKISGQTDYERFFRKIKDKIWARKLQ